MEMGWPTSSDKWKAPLECFFLDLCTMIICYFSLYTKLNTVENFL